MKIVIDVEYCGNGNATTAEEEVQGLADFLEGAIIEELGGDPVIRFAPIVVVP